MYLFVIVDWFTREIVDYEISYSLEKSLFALHSDVLYVAQARNNKLRSRQPFYLQGLFGSARKLPISMDGKGQAMITPALKGFPQLEIWWYIYQKEYTTPKEMIAGVNKYIHDYNTVRPMLH